MVTRDMPSTLAFYRLLGLDIPAAGPDEQHVDVITPNGYRLAWDDIELIKSLNPEWVEPAGNRMSLAFRCDSPAEVDALYQQVLDAGHSSVRAPYDAFWGQRYATVVDPDGNHVDLFAAL
jgi:catechol 2,3-dioxygenase-like lactoylglutathione lyase family enzyme